MLGILATLRVSFELSISRPGIMAAVAIYAATAAVLPRLHQRLTRGGSERLMLAADLLMAAVVSRLSGGVLSPYFGLWYLAMLHAALVLRPPVALGVAAGATAAVVMNEICSPADPFVLLHLYTTLSKLSILPLIAWAGSRLARELREREVERRQANRRATASVAGEVRIQKEMASARRVQESFLPRDLPAPPGMSLAALFCPAQEVGGDIYDLIELPDGRLLVALVDVCGKGVPAAMLAVAVQHGIRQFAGPDPAAVLAEVNRLLLDRTPDDMFATAACVVISPSDGHVAAASAGHPAPLRWDHQGQNLVALGSRGLALGVGHEWTGQTDQFCLAPGDALLLYTDGVVDAKTGERERLGADGLTQRLRQSPPEDAGHWLARLLHTLNGCAEWPDDVTAIAIVRALREETRRAA
jgi:serine phosphatase RsbU (regulator of sigma subunit)